MSEPVENRYLGLCYRCEHRARYNETRHHKHPSRLRMQCGGERAVYSCYAYRPVVPLVLKKDEDDSRPQFAPAMISARSHPIRLAEARLLAAVTASTMKLRAAKAGEDGDILYWDCSEEELANMMTIWLPFRYRLYFHFKLELYRTHMLSLPMRLFNRIIFTIMDWKDSLMTAIWRKFRNEPEHLEDDMEYDNEGETDEKEDNSDMSRPSKES